MTLTHNFDAVFAGLDALKENSLLGGARGLDDLAVSITSDMKATTAHGDITGATRASYVAYRVGLGKDGTPALDSVDAVGALNPGHAALGTAHIDGALGLIIMSGTDYQVKLETEQAGLKAVLTPTFLAYYLAITQAFAQGAKDNL